MTDKPHTPPKTLARAREIAVRNGLHYVYTGNVHDFAGSSTYCRDCDTVLIGRDWHELSNMTMRDGKPLCANCRAPIAGVSEDKPGTWGARRRSPQLAAA